MTGLCDIVYNLEGRYEQDEGFRMGRRLAHGTIEFMDSCKFPSRLMRLVNSLFQIVSQVVIPDDE